MTDRHGISLCFIMMLSLLVSVYGCNHSVDNQHFIKGVTNITETGTQGPADFIGNIDTSDWDRSNYKTIIFGRSFWLQKPTLSDTLFFGGRLSGDSMSQPLKIYNQGSSVLSIKFDPVAPFFSGQDSVDIPGFSLGTITITFILPDTTNTYTSNVTLRFSTQDSIRFTLQGHHDTSGSGVVGIHLPASYSLNPAYPNPTNSQITFNFVLVQNINTSLKIIDQDEQVVATVAETTFVAGSHNFIWNPSLVSGFYRVVFQAGNYISHGDIRILR